MGYVEPIEVNGKEIEVNIKGREFGKVVKQVCHKENVKERITSLYEDIEKRVEQEAEYISQTANPEKTKQEYLKNIRWYSAELAAYLDNRISIIGQIRSSEIVESKEKNPANISSDLTSETINQKRKKAGLEEINNVSANKALFTKAQYDRLQSHQE